MRLYLVQHGEANPKDIDPDRHLAEEGARNAQKMAAFLAPLGLSLNALWHSGKTRAAETAEILAPALTLGDGMVQRDGIAPNDPVKPVRKQLAKADSDVMIVGHIPFLNKLASALIAGDESANVIAFRNAGIVCIERGEDDAWSMQWIVIPQLLS